MSGPAGGTRRTLGPTARTSPDAVDGVLDDPGGTTIQRCVQRELARYFELLDGEPPTDLYRTVMQQVEASLLDAVLRECDGNRSRAATWLGISRGTLRGKLADHGRIGTGDAPGGGGA